MDDAIPFAAIFAIMGVFAWTTWPKRELVAGVLVVVAIFILGFRAVELS